MSGTDHTIITNPAPGPAIILVEPQMGENIGAAARAMWNFGLDRMRLVNPRDGWPNQKAVAMSSGAARVIDAVRLTQTTAQAVDDLHHVYATTARPRDLTKPVMTPSAAMADAAKRVGEGQSVGILFGPERAGLANDDVARANTIISVPVNPAFGSLNLAQCVLLLAYEWRLQGDKTPALQVSGKARPANGQEVDALKARLETALDARGFFFPDDKRASMLENLRNMISRWPLTDADVRTMHGIVRALSAKGRD